MNATPPTDHFYHSTDGLRLYCAVHGARQAGGLRVLCLPGLTRNSRDFVTLAAHLSEQRQVLAADLRGRGLSAWDPDPTHYQLPTYVGDVWSLIDSRALRRVVVVGTSLGALIGLVMAAMKPERIAGLVLNDAGPEIDPAGLRRIAGYAGKLPPVRSWEEAAAQAKIDEAVKKAIDAQKVETKATLDAERAASDRRIINSEVKAVAVSLGLQDVDAIKLIDTSSLKVDETTGEVAGVAELLTTFKTAKPYLFKEPLASTSSTSTPPPKKKAETFDARTATKEEIAADAKSRGLNLKAF